jgi:serine/threonine protein kinase
VTAALGEPSTALPVVNAHIRVDHFVAEGGFGRVYRGHHRTLDRAVAIKVLKVPEEYSDGMRAIFCERFAQEARIIASLDHPAVVRALDFGVARMPDGVAAPYMILDWLDGTTLTQALAARRRDGRAFDRDETLRLLTPVLEALAVAHARGIAHRDITPGNLMVVETPTGPALRLLDFGIAKVMDDTRPSGAEGREETHTHTALLAFSPRWAAPEQAARGRTGPWTDVHALGLVLTSMLTNEKPYRGANEALFQEIFSERRPSPAAFGVDVGTWEPVIARAVAARPESRQADAGELLRELQDALIPPSPTRLLSIPAYLRAPKPAPAAARSSPVLYAIAGAVAALLLVAAVIVAGASRQRTAVPAVAPAPPPASPPVVLQAPVPQVDPMQVLRPDLAPAPAPPRRAPTPPRARAPRVEAPAESPAPAQSPVSAARPATPRVDPGARRRIDPVTEYP